MPMDKEFLVYGRHKFKFACEIPVIALHSSKFTQIHKEYRTKYCKFIL
jgi:hypothetical protein